MANNMLTDDPCPNKLQIISQEDLLTFNYKIHAMLETLVVYADLNVYPTAELHTYLNVIHDLSEQAISLNQKIISEMTKR